MFERSGGHAEMQLPSLDSMLLGGRKMQRHVRRSDLIDHLDDWWRDTEISPSRSAHRSGWGGEDLDSAIDWMQSRLNDLPILVLAPSSSIGDGISSQSDLIGFLARYLHNLTGVRAEALLGATRSSSSAASHTRGPRLPFISLTASINEHPAIGSECLPAVAGRSVPSTCP